MRNLYLAAIAAVSLAACGGETDKAAAPAADATAAATPAADVATASALTLNGEGLAVTGPTPKQIAFGTPKAEFLTAVNSVLGAPPIPEAENADCPTGPVTMVEWNGLSATIQGGNFAGWLVKDGSLKTNAGLGVTSTRAEIQAGPGYAMETDSTLGSEFNVDGVGGMYNGDGADAGVEMLFAGEVCFAR